MNTLKQIIGNRMRKYLGALIPVKTLGKVDPRQEPPAMAMNMDAGRIMAVVSAAEGGYTRDLFSLYRDVVLVDSHLQGEWMKRKLAVLGDNLTILPYDKKDQNDVTTAERVKEAIDNCKTWRVANSYLLDSTLYPVSVVEKTFRATGSGYAIEALTPVPYHLLDYTAGKMRIYDVDPLNGTVLATSHDPDPNRYIIHRGHLLTSQDNWGGPFRSILFWWLLSAMDREWWARFLERYGAPFLVGKFADDEGMNVLERAFSMATKLGGLVISRETSVEIQKTSASDSGDAYDKFLTICQREKSKLILGQTLSSEAQSTGLGSGVSTLQGNVRDDLRKFDATLLADTLSHQLITQFCAINNLPGRVPKLVWGSQSNEEVKSTGALLQSLATANLELTDSGVTQLSENLGLSLQRRTSVPAVTPFNASEQRMVAARQIIGESRSKSEAVSRLTKLFPELPQARLITLIADFKV